MAVFSSLLDNTADHRLEIISAIKADNLPVVIYGAGFAGRAVEGFLLEHGISNIIFAVDLEFIPSTHTQLLSPAQADAQFERYHLILGRMLDVPFESLTQFKHAVKKHVLTHVGMRNTLELQLIDGDFLEKHLEDFEQTYFMLDDEMSKQIMKAHLRAHLTLDGGIMLPYASRGDGYFYDNLFSIKADLSYVDCGVFDGADILRFASKYEGYKKIIGFEPDENNYSMSVESTKNLRNVTLLKKGCSDKKEILRFGALDEDGMCNSIHLPADYKNAKWTQIEVDRIDEYTKESGPIGLMKMDIEGAELSALKGAAETIVRDKPVLAICAYHKRDDLIALPQYIKSLVPEYKLYLRVLDSFYGQSLSEMALYAVYPE